MDVHLFSIYKMTDLQLNLVIERVIEQGENKLMSHSELLAELNALDNQNECTKASVIIFQNN